MESCHLDTIVSDANSVGGIYFPCYTRKHVYQLICSTADVTETDPFHIQKKPYESLLIDKILPDFSPQLTVEFFKTSGYSYNGVSSLNIAVIDYYMGVFFLDGTEIGYLPPHVLVCAVPDDEPVDGEYTIAYDKVGECLSHYFYVFDTIPNIKQVKSENPNLLSPSKDDLYNLPDDLKKRALNQLMTGIYNVVRIEDYQVGTNIQLLLKESLVKIEELIVQLTEIYHIIDSTVHNCKIATTSGNVASVIGMIMLPTPFFFAGLSLMAAGAATSIGTQVTQHVLESHWTDKVVEHVNNIFSLIETLWVSLGSRQIQISSIFKFNLLSPQILLHRGLQIDNFKPLAEHVLSQPASVVANIPVKHLDIVFSDKELAESYDFSIDLCSNSNDNDLSANSTSFNDKKFIAPPSNVGGAVAIGTAKFVASRLLSILGVGITVADTVTTWTDDNATLIELKRFLNDFKNIQSDLISLKDVIDIHLDHYQFED